MTNRAILLIFLLSYSFIQVYSQPKTSTPEFLALDNSLFKWKEFSFSRPWEKVKKSCDIEKIETYENDYQNYFCGNISDTTKSYTLDNKNYHEFNSVWFDQVILHIIGSTTSRFNYSSLYFIKQFSNSAQASISYNDILKSFKSKYGNSFTKHLEKYKKEIADSVSQNTIYTYLNQSSPFSKVDETEWSGSDNIHMKLSFIEETNLMVLSVKEYASKSFDINARNWFSESNSDENFSDAFKEFDNKNGYKGLKFGMLKSVVKNIVKYKDPDMLKQYEVATSEYKNWFYIPFDFCYLMFNKKDKLYDVSLSKDEYSNSDYEQFLADLSELFGSPMTYKEKNRNSEYTLWEGRNINFFVMRPNDGSIYVDFNCFGLDDTSPTDKLY